MLNSVNGTRMTAPKKKIALVTTAILVLFQRILHSVHRLDGAGLKVVDQFIPCSRQRC